MANRVLNSILRWLEKWSRKSHAFQVFSSNNGKRRGHQIRSWKQKMLSVNYSEILSKPQYTCTESKYLCVLLNGHVVLEFAPVAAISISEICPDSVPTGHLCEDSHHVLSMGLCLWSQNNFQCHAHPSVQHKTYESTFLWCFCYAITTDILVLVGSGSLENSSLTHGKVFGVWLAEKKRCVLKPCMLAWSQSQNWVFISSSFFHV